MGPDTGSRSGDDLVDALVARIDDLDAQVRATASAVDEKSLKEFRRTVEALAKRDPKFEERVTNKVGVVADRLETLARTVSSTSAALAAKDGELAQIRRDLDAGSARLQAAVADARRAHDPKAIEEIKRALADLSKQKLPRGLEGRIEELGSKLMLLGQRIDTVSSTVSTTAAGLAGRDGDLIALRRAYEADSDRIGAELAEVRRAVDPTPVAELRQAIVELRERTSEQRRSVQLLFDDAQLKTDALATRVDTVAASVASASARMSGAEEQLSGLRAHVEEAGVHMNALAAAIASAGERLDARDVELEALEQRFRDASARVDGLVDELSRALAEFPDPATSERALESRLRELDRVRANDRVRIEEIADRLESIVASLADGAPESEELERRLDEIGTRFDALDDDKAGASSELARLAAVIEVERAGVRSRLETLAAAQEGWTGAVSTDELERRVGAFADRLEATEREREALATRVGRLGSAFDTERASFQTQLEALAAALSWTSPRSSDERLDELDRRMRDLERESSTMASKLSQATTLVPTALRSLEARLDEVALGSRTAPVSSRGLPGYSPPGEPPDPIDVDDERDEAGGEPAMPLTSGVMPHGETDP